MKKYLGGLFCFVIVFGVFLLRPQIDYQLLGIWADGIWIWNQFADTWTKIPSTSNAMMVTAGNVDGDDADDIIGVWPSGLWICNSSDGKWVHLSHAIPNSIAIGDFIHIGRDDIIGSWPNDGVYLRDSSAGKWEKIASSARLLAAGDIDGDKQDDLIGYWDSGLWVRYGGKTGWKKIDSPVPVSVAVGDMTGSGRGNIVISSEAGTLYLDHETAKWKKITTPAEQLAVGDIDGDGRDDLIGAWPSGLSVRYGGRNQWQPIKISSIPKWIVAGKISMNLNAFGKVDDPVNYPLGSDMKMNIIELSMNGPGGTGIK